MESAATLKVPQNIEMIQLEFEFEETPPRSPGRGRRVAVIVMGMIVAGVVLSIIGLTLTRGSWWYTYGTDQALDHETRARVETIRDEVDASGAFPEVVTLSLIHI